MCVLCACVVQKRPLKLLDLGFQAVVNFLTQVLGTRLQKSNKYS